MAAIKRNIRDLSLDDLIKKKKEITEFLLNFPKNPRNDQGWITLGVIAEMIGAKEKNDQFREMVIKELFFE